MTKAIPASLDTSFEHSSSDAEDMSGASSRKQKPSTSKHEASALATSSAPAPGPEGTISANPTRHERFWFHDGSVILHVENTLFRVHQTILANHSEIFAGLFEVPQPAGEMMLEGCHIVVLHDNEKDFEDLLHAVYDPSYFDSIPPTTDVDTLLTSIAGILRLSTKYILKPLRTRCITLLTSKFPSTFASYCTKSTTPSLHERYKSDTVMRAVTLAKETNVPTILPYAYYCVARMSMKRLMKEREGDLGWKEKCLCMVGRERLRWAEMSVSHSFLLVFQRSSTCTTLTCAHTRGPHAEWHLLEAGKSPNPLRAFVRWPQLNVCKDCEVYCQGVHLAGRRDVWKRLPSFFDLPAWEVLEEIQNQ
ncbi:hypothetical protein D9611_013173 [Ephemerocybe angulata]|uniref:BTB domain-containing protein n=1 Tax=Ephemerocybe angulata TaxID=980116 RepID=A0A8H5BT91_9AGAR|nr:hypothetical protein D9611_013173 [Tulosesus angulatus]